jgi:hypothetical protein
MKCSIYRHYNQAPLWAGTRIEGSFGSRRLDWQVGLAVGVNSEHAQFDPEAFVATREFWILRENGDFDFSLQSQLFSFEDSLQTPPPKASALSAEAFGHCAGELGKGSIRHSSKLGRIGLLSI